MSIGLLADTPLGLLVGTEPTSGGDRGTLLDPGTGSTLALYPEVHGVAGDLVLAGDFDRFGEAIAVWRPGQDHLALKRVDLPDPDGSDTFVAWPAAA